MLGVSIESATWDEQKGNADPSHTPVQMLAQLNIPSREGMFEKPFQAFQTGVCSRLFLLIYMFRYPFFNDHRHCVNIALNVLILKAQESHSQ